MYDAWIIILVLYSKLFSDTNILQLLVRTMQPVLLFILFINLKSVVNTVDILNRKKEKLTKDDAEKVCKHLESELLSYSQVTVPNLLPVYIKNLKDGDSAWVSAYATFSLPVVYRGCYEGKNNKFVVFDPVEFESKDIYSCINYCLENIKFRYFTTELFGITNKTCLCLNKMDLNRLRSVEDSRCDNECSPFDIDSCGGKNVLSVYRLYENETLIWAKNDHDQGQCINVKLKDNGKRIKAYTASCLDKSVKTGGYFCQHGAHSHLGGACSIRDKSGPYCLVHTSSTRQSAQEACLSHSGVLADLNSEQHLIELMKYKTYYWLGVHRAYTVTETRSAFSTACLAVTKVNRTLRLDPDNCNKKKYFFCEVMDNSMAPRVTPGASLGTSKLHNNGKSPKPTAKRISSTDTSLHTTVKRMRTERTKQPVSNQDETTAQTPNSVSGKSRDGISRDKLKTTLNYKAETAISEISSTLFSRTFLVTEKPASHSEGLSHTSSSKPSSGPSGIGNNISDYPQSTVDNTGNSEQETTARITQDSSNSSNSDASNGSSMSNILFAVAGAVFVIVVVGIIIIVKKKCHRSDKFNSTVKQVPNKKNDPYCIVGEDSVMHTAEFTKQNVATFYTKKSSTQSVVYDEPESTSFKPAKQDELENHQYDRIKFNYENANAVREAFETRYETGIGLNTYDHGVNFPKTNPNNSNYYVLERMEK